ncbi:hypothetical protein [Meiothermus sp.]|uniref:hypothetical protein n=1 Tax=Meiothermus sp. TaxID=1955249 RepID=UPI0021DEEAF5|nr:hypothetical protein [Meiothermus sp.]GIW33727.1 MAG: hypothetical protein KatS3mg072_1060 [Meiothermus sp.]
MRKIAFPLLLGSLVLALSSCIIVGTIPVSNFRFDSNWQRNTDGRYVFCTNKTTQMRYKFRAPDSSVITSIEETYVGFASERTLTLNRPLADLTRDGSDLVFVGTLTFGQGGVPQSLPSGVSQQSIVVTPITPPPSITGKTTVTVTVSTLSGSQYSGSYVYDVYSNCP